MRGSELWGRGALDMKGQVAAEAVAIASLAREGFEPAGDLVFAACADEEVGEAYGLAWLCEHHPDAVRTDYALNEGAGERMELFGRTFYLCSSAEKMSSPFRLLVHGRAGHASVPGIADNALVKAAPLIERLAAYRPELRLGPETTAMIKAVAGRELEPAEALELARETDPAAAELLEPLLSLTLSPTMISASDTRNVIPYLCEVVVDCRLLPGQTQDEVEPVLSAGARRGRVRLRVARRPRRHALRARDAALVGGRELRRRRRARGDRAAGLRGRLHRQPLAARRFRHGRVRLLPDEGDGSRSWPRG